MNKEVVLSLSGNPCNGKSTAAAHLAEVYGFEIVRPSDMIRAFAHDNNLCLDERNDYINAHNIMLDEFGEDYVVNTMIDSPGNRLCIDGERIPRHIERLQGLGARVMAFWCPLEARYQRSVKRGEQRDKSQLQAFSEDESREYQSVNRPYTSVMTVMQMANFHIDASQPLERVLASVDSHVIPLLDA